MDIKTLLKEAHRILAEQEIDHALIGGIALGYHGIQRFTNDVDFIVNGEDRFGVKNAFLSRGYTVFFESNEVLQLAGPGNIDFLFANRELSKAMLVQAKVIEGFGVKCLGVEDLIGLKIQAYKNDAKRELQDKADIQSLMEKNRKLDWQKIKLYADIFDEWLIVQDLHKKSKG